MLPNSASCRNSRVHKLIHSGRPHHRSLWQALRASAPARWPNLLPANLDGQANTDGLQLLQMEKLIIVNEPLGAVQTLDLPLKDEIDNSIKKKLQFLDATMGHEGEHLSTSPFWLKATAKHPTTCSCYLAPFFRTYFRLHEVKCLQDQVK